MNKKGQTTSITLFDLFLILAASVVIYFVVSVILFAGSKSANFDAEDNVADFKRIDAALQNIRIQMQEGADLERTNLNNLISRSKVLGGKTITSCLDYVEEKDCVDDTVSVGPEDGSCQWNEEGGRCLLIWN